MVDENKYDCRHMSCNDIVDSCCEALKEISNRNEIFNVFEC